MNESELLRRYTYKLSPNQAQDAEMHRIRRMMGELYNALLQQRIEAWSRQGKSLSYYDQCLEITALRRECQEWAALSSSSMTATAQRSDRAYKAFFARVKRGHRHDAGFPRFKRTADYPSVAYKRHRDCWRFDFGREKKQGRPEDGWLHLRGVPGRIKARGRLPERPKQIKTCEILWRADQWWLSLVVEMEPRRVAGEGKAIMTLDLVTKFADVREDLGDGARRAGPKGVDFSNLDGRISPDDEGVSDGSHAATPDSGADDGYQKQRATLVLHAATPDSGADDGCKDDRAVNLNHAATPDSGADDGDQWGEPFDIVHAVTPESGAGTLQRAMSRCRRGSNRYRKLKRQLTRLMARQARQRREGLHEYTTALQRRYRDIDVIAPASIKAETESGKGDAKRHGAEVRFKARLNRRILDFAPAEAVAQIEYKFAEAGGIATRKTHDAPPTRIGAAVVAATKSVRKAKRKAKENARRTT